MYAMRRKRKISRTAFARAAGVHHGHMGHLESGLAAPTIDTLESIGAALGVRASDLLNTRQSDEERVYELLRKHPELVTVAREKTERKLALQSSGA
jgi:transcriptional regulator with XRE-family HTH domain